jgi:hypothetical protein
MMEWILKVFIPIIGAVASVTIYLHQTHKRAMDKKADKETVVLKFKELDKDIHEIKEDRRDMEIKLMSELKYIRERVDQVADRT